MESKAFLPWSTGLRRAAVQLCRLRAIASSVCFLGFLRIPWALNLVAVWFQCRRLKKRHLVSIGSSLLSRFVLCGTKYWFDRLHQPSFHWQLVWMDRFTSSKCLHMIMSPLTESLPYIAIPQNSVQLYLLSVFIISGERSDY